MHLIAVGHRPPHGPLTIVSHPAYGELAILPGERVEDIVEAAEAVIEEMERMPNLEVELEPVVCGGCQRLSTTVKNRRRNTEYIIDDSLNWIECCQDCFDEDWQYFQELWDEYYASRI